MPQAIWTPIAEQDLDEILYYIALQDRRPETAISIYYEIRDAVDERVLNAVPGQHHPDAPPDWLCFSYKRWVIFYLPHADGIEVMRIVDGARDLPSAL